MFETERVIGEAMIDKIERLSIPEPNSGCWIWLASTGGEGDRLYGYAWSGVKNVRAHRVSYEAYNGSIPDDTLVLHRCDNPLCVNPDHLFLGSHQDNSLDYNRKWDAKSGIYAFKKARFKLTPELIEKLGLQKRNKSADRLTEFQVHMIRALRAVHKASHNELSTLFGISYSHIRHICYGKKWASVSALDYQKFLDDYASASGSVASKQLLPAQ